MKYTPKIGSIVFLLLAILVACKHHPETIMDIIPPDNGGNGGGGNPNDTIVDPCSPDSVYFTNTILPLITSRCAMSGCHLEVTDTNRSVVLTNYAQIMEYVEPGDLDGSELWDDAIAETDPDKIMPRPYATPLSETEKEAIKKWIQQGARNNSCTECDSTFAFAADILPIIQNNCIGCHSGNDPEAGLLLVTYSDIQAAVTSNGLMDRVNNANNPMPPTNQLNDCIKNQIQSWIDAGMPNN
jgi:uncharacterized membrane protein